MDQRHKIRSSALLALLLSACQPGGIQQVSIAENSNYLDTVNRQAVGDPAWFVHGGGDLEKLGKKYHGSVAPQLATYLDRDVYIVENAAINRYLQGISDRLLSAWIGVKPSLSFVLVSGEQLNAYVDAYNQVHVYTGLLRGVENEDQLAGVLAHELSHVLLKHNQDKQAARSVSWSVEMAGALSIAAAGLAYEKKENDKYLEYAERALIGSQSLGMAWSDMLAPAWARDDENEADRLGIDLLMRAGYNYEEFYKVIEKLQDSSLRRSQRQQFFSALAASMLDKNKESFYGDKPDSDKGKLVGGLKTLGSSVIAAMTLESIAKGNTEHDTREQRLDSLKQYVRDVHQGGDLPPEADAASLRRILGRGTAKKVLEADLAAMQTIDALNQEDLAVADKRARKLRLGMKLERSVVSVGIARSFLKTSARRTTDAQRVLSSMSRSETAPTEVYLRLARLQLQGRNYQAAKATLELGVSRIGRNYRFLPELIATHKALNEIEAAENYADQCAKGDGEDISLASMVLSGNSQGSPAHYHMCTKQLGYDIVAKRRQESEAAEQLRKQQQTENKQKLKDIKEKLKGLWGG